MPETPLRLARSLGKCFLRIHDGPALFWPLARERGATLARP